MDVIIEKPIEGGLIEIIPSKSLTHRALIAAALAEGTSTIKRPLYSKDTEATIEMLRSLGAVIHTYPDRIEVTGKGIHQTDEVLYANESGSTLRFLIPIALTEAGWHTFDGAPGLRKRPLSEYISIFHQKNMQFIKNDENLPIKIQGKLTPGTYVLKGDISSQFITGLLYALPRLNRDSIIELENPLESKDYVLMTISMLKHFGIKIEFKDNRFYVPGNQKYQKNDIEISGDFSQAAFFFIGGILGANIVLEKIDINTHQADERVLEFVESMNGHYILENSSIKPYYSKTRGMIIDLSQSPDIGPIMAVLCALSEGKSEIINASRLRIKESDRITAIATELRKLGAKIIETKDGMKITGVKSFKGNVTLDAWNDHRIVMALSIAAIKTDGPIRLKGAEAVEKSYPDFFKDYMKLKGVVRYE